MTDKQILETLQDEYNKLQDTYVELMNMNKYLLRRYDTYFNDVRNETIIECVDDETAIRAAKSSLYLSVHPLDTCEIQVCRKGLSTGEWCMFAAVFYDGYGNDLYHIGVEDCFC